MWKLYNHEENKVKLPSNYSKITGIMKSFLLPGKNCAYRI